MPANSPAGEWAFRLNPSLHPSRTTSAPAENTCAGEARALLRTNNPFAHRLHIFV